jgi:superfamily I DNA/RNA helicase
VQRIVASAAWDEEALEGLDLEARERLRAQTVWLLKALLPLDQDLRDWIKAAAGLLTEAATALNDPPAKKGGHLLKSGKEQTGTRARDAFVPRPRELETQTVHDIKGEDRDAVLVVVDLARSAKRDAQARLWSSVLTGEEIDAEQAEEKRIAFVALTRAKRICVVALPDDTDGRQAAAAFLAQGFRLIDAA